MSEEVTVLLICISWAVIAFSVAYNKNGFSRIAPPAPRPSKALFFFGTAWAFMFYLLIQVVIVPKISRRALCGTANVCEASDDVLTVLTDLGVISAAIAVILLSLLPVYRHIIWGEGNYIVKFFKGARWWFFVYPVAVLVSNFVGMVVHLLIEYEPVTQVAVDFLMQLKTTPLLLYLNAIMVVLIVPLAEEILFRGFFFNALKSFMPLALAIPINALLFAFFHFDPTQSYSNIELISVIWVLGMVLCWVYERENSIWSSYGLHATFNFVSVIGIILR